MPRRLAKGENIGVEEVQIAGAEDVDPAGNGGIDNRIVVRILRNDSRPNCGFDELGQPQMASSCS